MEINKERKAIDFQTWEKRWQYSCHKDQLTIFGKMMFRAKKRCLKTILKDLTIKDVIEVGCGEGHILQVYKEMGLECIGIDISPNAVKICEAKGLNAKLGNVEDETATYDFVSSDGIFEHLLNFESVAVHLMRISKKYVLLIQPNHDSLVGKTAAYFAEILRGHENVFEYNYRINDFIQIFKFHRFNLKLSIPVFYDVFRVLLFKKELNDFVQR